MTNPTRAACDERPIGIFDSGVGGLTVLRQVRQVLPEERIVYLGDTARVPYGNKAPSTVSRYAVGCAQFLVRRDVKALVIACNTAAAFGLRAVMEQFVDIPVIGVIDPVAAAAAAHSRSGRIGVVGTRGTVRSEAYVEAVHACRPDARVVQQPCPLFVPLAEEGWLDDPVTEAIARRYLEGFRDSGIDALILGCTHYPLLRPVVERVLAELVGPGVAVLDSATTTAAALVRELDASDGRGIGRRHGAAELVHFCVTDEPERFVATSAGFLDGERIERVEHVDL